MEDSGKSSSSSMAVRGFNYDTLNQYFQDFATEHKNVVDRGGILSAEATTTAHRLADLTQQMRNQIRNAENISEAEAYLKRSESVLPLAYKLSTLIVDPHIQFLQDLKYEMSEATRSLMEIGVLQCSVQQARAYEDTIREINGNLRKVIKTLPKTQCLTEFNLKLADASTRGVEFGKGKWREIRLAGVQDIAKGLLEVVFTASPAPPFVNIGPLVFPVIRLIDTIYSNAELEWCKAIQILQFGAEKGILKEKGGFGKIRAYLAKNHNDYKVAFYLTTLFEEMLKDSNYDALRDEIISGDELSLKTLVGHQKRTWNLTKKRNEDKFWRVRYNAVRVLGQISDKENIVIPLMLARAGAPGERSEVIDLVKSIIATRAQAKKPTAAIVSSSMRDAQDLVGKAEQSLNQRGVVSQQVVANKLKSVKAECDQLRHKISTRGQRPGNRVNESVGTLDDQIPDEEAISLEQVEAQLQEREERLLQIEALQQELYEVSEAKQTLAEIETALKTGDWTAFV